MYLDKGRAVSLTGDVCSPGISWQCWTLYFIWGPKRCQCKWGKPSLGWKAIINLSQRAKTSTEATTWYVLKNKEIPLAGSATPKIPERPQKSNKVGWWQNYKQLKNTEGGRWVLVRIYNQEMSPYRRFMTKCKSLVTLKDWTTWLDFSRKHLKEPTQF